jgi:hypothetical protein
LIVLTSVLDTSTNSYLTLPPFWFRLEQNRKSAKKCRLKKKAEFKNMRTGVDALRNENKYLKEKVSPHLLILTLDS